jgi:hypothetical protein
MEREKSSREENPRSCHEDFGEFEAAEQHGVVATLMTDDASQKSTNDETTDNNNTYQQDTSKYTPKTSNKRILTIQQTEAIQHIISPSSSTTTMYSLTAIHEQDSSLPLRNPLHNNDENDDDDDHEHENTTTSHFEVDQVSDHDVQPVAPTRKPSAGSFRGMSTKVKATEAELQLLDEKVDSEKVGNGAELDVESVTSSYVGDVDERILEVHDIPFGPDSDMNVESTVSPKKKSLQISSVHTEATSTMSASGVTNTNVVPISWGCTSPGGREINFSPENSNVLGPADPKHGSVRGNSNEKVGTAAAEEDSVIPSTSNIRAVSAEDVGWVDPTILDLEQILDSALNDGLIISEEPAAELASSENPLSESMIPSESFLKMGAMMQSQIESSGTLHDDSLAGDEGKNKTIDDNRSHCLDGDLILPEKREGETMKELGRPKDDHDDLLDAILDDDKLKSDRQAKDITFATILVNEEAGLEKQKEHVPYEAAKMLQELDGESVRHETITVDENTKAIEALQKLEYECSDLMARALDALLVDQDLEEEINFDVDHTPSEEKQTSNAVDPSPKPSTFDSTKSNPRSIRINEPMTSMEIRQNKTTVGRVFQQWTPPEKLKREPVEDVSRKKKQMFGFGKKVDKREDDSIPKPASTGTALKRFMSPTIAFMRQVSLAAEERATREDDNCRTPPHKSLKPSRKLFKKSFTSTFSSWRKFKSNTPLTEKKGSPKQQQYHQHQQQQQQQQQSRRRNVGNILKSDGTKSRIHGAFMEPTFAKTMLETETRTLQQRKALEKAKEAKRVVVGLSTWEEDRILSPYLDCSYQTGIRKNFPSSPRTLNQHETAGNTVPRFTQGRKIVKWTPNSMTPTTSKKDIAVVQSISVEPSPQKVFSPRSYSSLSSQCSIQSFQSPGKAGIVGCQSRYNPYLHHLKGPCELCIFQLSDKDKDELDTHGRHLLVQFTTGGCTDCLAFPTTFDEAPVRLCPRCYSNSHRPKQNRCRKKGNDSARIGYMFAKKEYL